MSAQMRDKALFCCVGLVCRVCDCEHSLRVMDSGLAGKATFLVMTLRACAIAGFGCGNCS